MTIETHFINEPLLEFGRDQKLEHPQDCLFLYGPVAAPGNPGVIHVGVVGTQDGIDLVARWLVTLLRRLPVERPDQLHSSPWPGFQAAFGVRLETTPLVTLPLSGADISNAIRKTNRLTQCDLLFSYSTMRSMSISARTTGGRMYGSPWCRKLSTGTDARRSVVQRTRRHRN